MTKFRLQDKKTGKYVATNGRLDSLFSDSEAELYPKACMVEFSSRTDAEKVLPGIQAERAYRLAELEAVAYAPCPTPTILPEDYEFGCQ